MNTFLTANNILLTDGPSVALNEGRHYFALQMLFHLTDEQLASKDEIEMGDSVVVRTDGPECLICGMPYSVELSKVMCSGPPLATVA